MVNVGAAIGSISAPLVIGAFTQADHSDGWRSYYVSLWPTAGTELKLIPSVVGSTGLLGIHGRGSLLRLHASQATYPTRPSLLCPKTGNTRYSRNHSPHDRTGPLVSRSESWWRHIHLDRHACVVYAGGWHSDAGRVLRV